MKNLFLQYQNRFGNIYIKRSLNILIKLRCKISKFLFFIFIGPLPLIHLLVISTALIPGTCLIFIFKNSVYLVERPIFEIIFYATSLPVLWISYGLSLLFLVPIINFPFSLFVRPVCSNWYSLKLIPMYYHNSFVILTRYTFLNLYAFSPMTNFFFKMMGMKIGRDCVIHTTKILDPCLIELKGKCYLANDTFISAHSSENGKLAFKRLVIDSSAISE